MLLNCGVGETLESALDCKKIKPVNPKGNQSWIFIGRTDAEPETPILWPPDSKNRFIGKDPDAEKDWRQEEKSTTEDEMVGWHQQLDGHEFEQALGIGDGQGILACCNPWGRRVGHNWATELNWKTSMKMTKRGLSFMQCLSFLSYSSYRWRTKCSIHLHSSLYWKKHVKPYMFD